MYARPILKWETAGHPWWLSGKETTCQCKRQEFDPWSGKIPHAAGKLKQNETKGIHHVTSQQEPFVSVYKLGIF